MKHIYRALLCVALLFSWQGVAAQDFHEHLGSTSVAEELKIISFNIRYNSSILDTALLAFNYVHLTPACDQVSTKLCHAITYNAFGKGPGASIDHFFVRGDIEVKQYRILDGDYGVPYISDHYPIEVILSL